ncbi:MAG TPA: hypothetical protein VLF67_01670 [Candidatus Saccharimonas sp.]|nr:hypothetical protein [Candidatus Saccharimonas sp.]
MTSTTAVTPAEAFDQIRARVASGLQMSGQTPLTAYAGRGERYRFYGAVKDQSVAYPGRAVEVTVTLCVIAMDSGQLRLRLDATWHSIYGRHTSEAEFLATKDESGVSIQARWLQGLPVSALDHLDIHTGGVSVEEYHRRSLETLRSSDRPVALMLYSGADRTIDPQDLVALADPIMANPPLF